MDINGGTMFNFIRFYDIDISKILGTEPRYCFREYKAPARPAKRRKKPLQRRRMMRR